MSRDLCPSSGVRLARHEIASSTLARCLTRNQAALYCALSPEGFDDWVKRGIVPGPIARTQRWDRKAIDLALDRASGIQQETGQAEAAYEAWRRTRAG